MKKGITRIFTTAQAAALVAALVIPAQSASAGGFSGCVMKSTPPLVVAANKGNKDAALEILRLAEAGNARAEYRVGKLYMNGWSFPVNYTKGVDWELKAAVSPDKCAAGSAASVLDAVAGENWPGSINVNYVKVNEAGYRIMVRALKRAARRGNAAAETYLGDAYRHANLGLNLGPRKNCLTAVGLLYKAARQGYAPAEELLGDAYTGGLSHVSTVCAPVSVYWARKGMRLFTESARQGYVLAEMDLVTMYRIGGPGIHRNPALAFYWRQKEPRWLRH